MIAPDDTRRVEPKSSRMGQGWSSLHSWIFLAIVALGLLVIGWQNRYFYLSPLGLGKAYRIDKLFGSIQEFDPSKGWIRAQIPSPPPPQAMSMMEPPRQSATPSAPMNMPPSVMEHPSATAVTPPPITTPTMPKVAEEKPAPPPQVVTKETVEEPRATEASSPREPVVTHEQQAPPPPPELTEKEKLEEFNRVFPEFGKDEFQLANDDLYPDWKKRVVPDGTWQEFLEVYGQFVQWWNDQGSPPEPGFKLWKEFTAKSLKR